MVESLIDRRSKEQQNKARQQMLDYIMKMVEYICSGNNEDDKRNIELLA